MTGKASSTPSTSASTRLRPRRTRTKGYPALLVGRRNTDASVSFAIAGVHRVCMPVVNGLALYARHLEGAPTSKEQFMAQRPEIVCLCGSMRFAPDIRRVSAELTLAGVIVLAPGETSLATAEPLTMEQKAKLDALHRHKIDLADRVVVVNPDGYVGESTRGEIEHARATGKSISFTQPVRPDRPQR